MSLEDMDARKHYPKETIDLVEDMVYMMMKHKLKGLTYEEYQKIKEARK